MSDKFVPDSRQPLPGWYQSSDMQRVFSHLMAGEFAQIIAVGGAGKSNFLRHIARDSVKSMYIQNGLHQSFLTVYIDPHMIVQNEDNDWGGVEIMLNRLRREVLALAIASKGTIMSDSDLLDKLERSYANLYSTNPLVAKSYIRHLEDSIFEVLSLGNNWNIVFLFDEFDKFLVNMSPIFFRALQGIRGDFKGRLMYATASRTPLNYLCNEIYAERAIEFEDFIELFNGFEVFLTPLDLQSAHNVVKRLETRNNVVIDETIKTHLLNITAGHASLLRRAFYVTRIIPSNSSYADVIRYLLNDPSINQECAMILSSLNDKETEIILGIAKSNQVSYDPAIIRLLQEKFILNLSNPVSIRIPVFGAWITNKHGIPRVPPR